MTEARLRIGLIGTGYWARTVHGPGLRVAEAAEFIGVWGRDEAKTCTFAEELGVKSYSDLDALFGAVDAVAIAVSPEAQRELTVRAARRVATSSWTNRSRCRSVRQRRSLPQFKENGVGSLVFFTARFLPDEEWVQETAKLRPGKVRTW